MLACSLSRGASVLPHAHVLTLWLIPHASLAHTSALVRPFLWVHVSRRQGDITACHARTGLHIETTGMLEKLHAVILSHMLAPCFSITSAHPTCPSMLACNVCSNLHVETSDLICCHSLSASSAFHVYSCASPCSYATMVCTGVQVETGEPICWLSSANLMEVAPTYHIARFLPSILESKAPFTFALQVCQPLQLSLTLRCLWFWEQTAGNGPRKSCRLFLRNNTRVWPGLPYSSCFHASACQKLFLKMHVYLSCCCQTQPGHSQATDCTRGRSVSGHAAIADCTRQGVPC